MSETTETILPSLNTWWCRKCNGKNYFLRQIHDCFGKTYVWIYQEGINKCLHIPLKTLLSKYTLIPTGPVDPKTGNVKCNNMPKKGFAKYIFIKGEEIRLDDIYDIQALAGGNWWRRKDENDELDESLIITRDITIEIIWR